LCDLRYRKKLTVARPIAAGYAQGEAAYLSCCLGDTMRVLETALSGVKIVEPAIFSDSRGRFFESFSAGRYRDAGISNDFVQDNVSVSLRGVLRGLHLQNPAQQGKLVMVLSGAVMDVAVDVRAGSPTFGRHVAIRLDGESHRQLWIPRGFAHGFAVLSDEAIFLYKCDAPYDRGSEIGIRWNDPDIGIDWGVEQPILSEKDAAAPFLRDLTAKLPQYQG
jgi:dTDP-4-dehydrorhamnose 3,5-epimerase